MLLKLNDKNSIELEDVLKYNDNEDYLHLECILKNSNEVTFDMLEKKYEELYIDNEKYTDLIFYSYSTSEENKRILCFSNNYNWYDTELTVKDLFDIHNEIHTILDCLSKKHIPETNNTYLQRLTYKTIDSVRINKLAGYTMLSKDWINDFAKWIGDKKVLEIGAGIGALAKQLQNRGIDITPIDDRSWDRFGWEYSELLWTEVLNEDYFTNAIKYKDCDLIILSYPIQGEFAAMVLELMRVFNPNCRMVFIGPFREDYADQRFIEVANVIKDDEDFNLISDKYMYWIGQPYMKSQLLYIK